MIQKHLTAITVSDIIYYSNRNSEVFDLRDNVKGGALTEVTFFILLALYQARHGYAIMQFVEEKTNGRLIIGAGSLYGALESLVKKGWITIYDESDARKKQFIITDEGKRVAKCELTRIQGLSYIANEIIGG